MKLLNVIGGVLFIGGLFVVMGGVGTLEIDNSIVGIYMIPYILLCIIGLISMGAGVAILNHTHQD